MTHVDQMDPEIKKRLEEFKDYLNANEMTFILMATQNKRRGLVASYGGAIQTVGDLFFFLARELADDFLGKKENGE